MNQPFGRPQRRPGGARIPVTVVSGPLGAGKTTLIQQLVRTERGRNTAVIVNEFADIGIDALLLQSVTDNVVLLGNGCLCCRIDSELHQTLARLKQQRTSGEVPDFEQVVLETSGLADPLPILQTLIADRTLQSDFHCRGLVTLVDASGLARGEWQPEALNQLQLADRVVVTKRDLADAATLDAARERLQQLNASAGIGFADHGKIDPGFLLDELALDAVDLPTRLRAAAAPVRHASDVRTFTLTLDEPIEWKAFSQFVESLSALRGPDLLRVKGLVHVAGVDGPVVIQLAQHVVHPPVQLVVWPEDQPCTRLVFITRNIPEHKVRGLLDALQAATV